MKNLHGLAAALALLVISTAASAQSTYSPAHRDVRGGSVKVGIVIPFGNAGSSTERAPRLEAWSEPGRQRDRAEQLLRTDRDQAYGPPARLGVTLAEQPRMMMNGREVPGQADRRNVSALGWVGITVGVALAIVGAAALGAFGQFST